MESLDGTNVNSTTRTFFIHCTVKTKANFTFPVLSRLNYVNFLPIRTVHKKPVEKKELTLKI